MEDTLKTIVGELVDLFEPLTEAAGDGPDGMYYFLEEAGVIDGFGDLPAQVERAVDSLREAATAVAWIANTLQKDGVRALFSAEGKRRFSALAEAAGDIDRLGRIRSGRVELDRAGSHIMNFLFIRYATFHRPGLFTFCYFTGAVKHIESTGRPVAPALSLAPVLQLFSDPVQWFRSEFGWGTAALNTDALLLRLKLLLEQWSLSPYFVYPENRPAGVAAYREGRLVIPLFHYRQNGQVIGAGLIIEPAVRAGRTAPEGLRVSLYGTAGLKNRMPFADGWEVRYASSAAAASPVVVDFFPDGSRIESGSRGGNLTVDLFFGRTGAREPWLLLGSEGGTRVEMGAWGVNLSAAVGQQNDLSIEFQVRDARLVIESKDGDGFLRNILPKGGLSIDFDPSPGWSSLDGLYFNGSAGLEVTLPIHRTIGPATMRELFFRLTLHGDKPSDIGVGASFSVAIGPVKALVSGVGLSFQTQLRRGGNLGLLQVDGPAFSPPDRIGLDLDTGLITGGGFLDLDRTRECYAGLLNLQMRTIALTGIGLIATRLPNGRDGFSMLVSINVVFFPPIQLSFGFTLAGVGGLIGINRTAKVDALRERIASGAVNSILFPENPIENADRIISDLQAVFPAEENHFVVAPFLRLGFGTPAIIEFDIGVVLEFPFKGRIILLGSLGIYLPSRDLRLVEIHIDVAGDFNFAQQYIQIEGRLRQSHVLGIPLKGGFAFVLDWGSRPAFLFSIGGYHPRYQKPARFPDIPRLSAVIRLGSVISLTCKYYQAITSNSFQIGFSAFLKAGAAGASLEGYYGFNALLQIDPLFFSVDSNLSVKVRYKGHTLAGIDLYYRLSGPSPWTASGYAEISVLFLSVKIRFSIEWGERREDPPVYVSTKDLLDRLEKSLTTPGNWSAELPARFRTGESLRPREEIREEGMVLHPSGFLRVRQSVLPLNRTIEKYGNAYLREKRRFRFAEIRIGGVVVTPSSYRSLQEHFARGQYEELSKAEQLSTPDFELMEAGLSFGDGLAGGFDLGRPEDLQFVEATEFKQIVLVPDQEPQRSPAPWGIAPAIQQRIVNRSLRMKKQLEEVGNRYRFRDRAPAVELAEAYQVVSVRDLTPVGNLRFETYGQAKQYLQHQPKETWRNLQIMTAGALETP